MLTVITIKNELFNPIATARGLAPGKFHNDSPYKPVGIMGIMTEESTPNVVSIPVFVDDITIPHCLQQACINEFLSQDFIKLVNGIDIKIARRWLQLEPEELDIVIDEHFANLACLSMNGTENEDAQEEILQHFEAKATDVNNQGKDAQLLQLLCL